MINEAEEFADVDRKNKESIEAVNSAENLIADIEKNMNEFKDQLDQPKADELKTKLEELRTVMKDGQDPEAITAKVNEVKQTSLSLFELVYKNRAAQASGNNSSSSSSTDANNQDAEFKDVNQK